MPLIVIMQVVSVAKWLVCFQSPTLNVAATPSLRVVAKFLFVDDFFVGDAGNLNCLVAVIYGKQNA